GDTIPHVYFPNDSIISLLAAVENRSTLEVGIVGNEGIAGICVFLGMNTSRYQALVQGEGTAMRMKTAAFSKESAHTGALHRLLLRYTNSLMTQISQSAACNRFHTVNARLARWLLMTRDRMGSDEFRLTQEFMSKMLGVRREGVSVAAAALQKSELINYNRGNITILERRGLEAVACNCYKIIKDESDSFLN
ncbi:MAG: Crp/Fnr family transcriptional regulator, partial [Acidobacteria bacterium]|nr:Crp/Fnr family transcriptional regulator [Acidobacteriota bacterium]